MTKLLTRLSAVAIAVFASVALVACGGSGFSKAEDLAKGAFNEAKAQITSETPTSWAKYSKVIDFESIKYSNEKYNETMKSFIDAGTIKAKPTELKVIKSDAKADYDYYTTLAKASVKHVKASSAFDKKEYDAIKKANKEVQKSITYGSIEKQGDAIDLTSTVGVKQQAYTLKYTVTKKVKVDDKGKVTGTEEITGDDQKVEVTIIISERNGKFFATPTGDAGALSDIGSSFSAFTF